MEYPYPKEFPNESRARVLAERIKAARAFEDGQRKVHDSLDLADLLKSCILRVLIVFVREAGALVRQGAPNWSVDRLESESQEFLRRLIIYARYGNGFCDSARRLPDMISSLDGSILSDVRRAFERSPLWREYEDILLEFATATSTSASCEAPADATMSEQPAVQAVWEDVEISFISDERVQVKFGGQPQTYNYAEMGFADRRTAKPNQAWGILRALAEAGGVIPEEARNAKHFIAMGKRIERTRQKLNNHFHIASDPIPLDRGRGYHCRFKIGCAPSFQK